KAKNRLFRELLQSEGVTLYETTIDLIRHLLERGIRTAVVSSSQNCRAVLQAAGIESLFLARVDGAVAKRLKLAGKPQPDIFLKSAEFVGVAPAEAIVIEDSQSGVRAGRAGEFGLVIGVDRGKQREALLQAGAHKVVDDLGEIDLEQMNEWFRESGD
ncbi:MAG: HAD-IA family hydrolase, partial [Xanthomonadales bacterium]|nr:HAD-IA family hydrolase [Xanthomonadales bacterium]